MNILHMKYAVEVAKYGSINKAAEALWMNQPNLSRAIKELEADLGAELFLRSSKGMVPTPEGETFLRYAGAIIKQVDEVEGLFKNSEPAKKRFSISVPRASYISEAFVNFSRQLRSVDSAEIYYKETNSQRAIKNILESDYRLGIIRYAEYFDKYYKSLLDDKSVSYEVIAEFKHFILVSEKSPLAEKENISLSDIDGLTELTHADPLVSSMPFEGAPRDIDRSESKKRIFVFERASQFELLSKNADMFMWVSPVPEHMLRKYSLVQRGCTENSRVYKDVMIHRKDYHLTRLDNAFISELCKTKRELFGVYER